MNTKLPELSDQSSEAARWRELIFLLQRKAYKTTMSPAEIAEQLPDLREVFRAASSPAPSYRRDMQWYA